VKSASLPAVTGGLVIRFASLFVLVACGGGGQGSSPDAAPGDNDDANVDPPIDASPPEPMPAFTVDGFTSGQLAVDEVGVRPQFIVNGQAALSHINLFLTEAGTQTSCVFAIFPSFVAFDAGSPSNRTFRTIQYDVATSTVVADECGWDDAYVLAEVKAQYGLAEVGWARARFDEDRPGLDVFFDAVMTFPGQSDSIVLAGAGAGFAMADDGTVDGNTLVEPIGGTLDRALYQW
jgi:hypothetical protein